MLDPIQEGESCWIESVSCKSGTVVGAYIVGPVFAGINFHVARSCLENELASLRNRVVQERLVPQASAWAEVELIAQRFVQPGHAVRPMPFKEWVATFEGTKRRLLEACYDSMLGKIPAKRVLKRYNCFIKREIKLAYAAFANQTWVSPRNIMSAKDVIKVILGPYFRAYSKYCHSVWNHQSPIYYEPGGSAEEVSEWVQQEPTWPLLENDFSRFDASNWEQSTNLKIYFAKCMGLDGEALRVYELLRETSKFTTRHGACCVRVPGTLSGHPDTTWSNTMINLTVQWYCILKSWQQREYPNLPFAKAIELKDCPQPGTHFRLCACGDDSIGRCLPSLVDKDRFVEAGKTLGYKMKYKAGHSLLQARFCSNAFYPTSNNGYLMAPTLKCLLKLGATVSDVGSRELRHQSAHMRGVALGLLKQTNHVPLLNDYIQMLLRSTAGAKGTFLNEARKEAERKYRKVEGSRAYESSTSLLYLSQMYGISLATLGTLRFEIAAMNQPGIYNSTAIEELTRRVAIVEDLG